MKRRNLLSRLTLLPHAHPLSIGDFQALQGGAVQMHITIGDVFRLL